MFSLNDSMRYWLFNEPTDMRKSYFTLSGLVRDKMGCNALNGDVYVFINKSRNRIKLLHMEPGGLVIYSKLLDRGTFRLPTFTKDSCKSGIQWRDLVIMIEGIIENPNQRLKRLKMNNIFQ